MTDTIEVGLTPEQFKRARVELVLDGEAVYVIVLDELLRGVTPEPGERIHVHWDLGVADSNGIVP